jgi:hypothetical protein
MSRTIRDVLISDVVSTAALKGLNDQLIATATNLGLKLVQLNSNLLVRNDRAVNLAFDPAIAADLPTIAKRFGRPIKINSAYRTLPQQFLLWRWSQEGLVGRAARPGTSNHEGGNAIDVEEWDDLKTHFKALGWVHQLDKTGDDPVHFEKGSGDRTIGVRAVQALWNLKNPSDRIAVDGIFGRNTEARLLRMPIDGYK